MSEETNYTIRLSKAAKEFNVGKDTIVEYLAKKGFQVDPSPNTKLTADMYGLLVKEYQGEKEVKNEAMKLGNLSYKGGSVSVDSALQSPKTAEEEDHDEVIIRTNTISSPAKKTTKKSAAVEPEQTEKPEQVETKEETPKQEVEKAEPEKKDSNTSGSTLKITSCAIALMMMLGMEVEFSTLLGFVMMLGVTMVAAPGVPGGAIMAALGILGSMLGFDAQTQAMMITLYIAMDSFGTACNVTGDGAIALIMDRIAARRSPAPTE